MYKNVLYRTKINRHPFGQLVLDRINYSVVYCVLNYALYYLKTKNKKLFIYEFFFCFYIFFFLKRDECVVKREKNM